MQFSPTLQQLTATASTHPTTTPFLRSLNRDYGFLPKRAPNLVDGAQLPAKFEPFPADLLGKPIEELDQYVYEKVSEIMPVLSDSSKRARPIELIKDGRIAGEMEMRGEK